MNTIPSKSRWPSSLLRFRVIAFDSLVNLVSLPLALYFCLDRDFWSLPRVLFWEATLVAFALSLATCVCFRIYKTVWRYISLDDLSRIFLSVTVSVGVFSLFTWNVATFSAFSRSVPGIYWCVQFSLLAGTRVLYRILLEWYFEHTRTQRVDAIPSLLLYTGNATELFLRYQQRDPQSPYNIVGIIDRDTYHLGRTIRAVRVVGTLENLAEAVLAQFSVPPKQLILTSDEVPGWSLQKIVQLAETAGLSVARLPSMLENVKGTIVAEPIVLEDLLGRPTQTLDPSVVAGLLKRKCVFVTGAGGSIGSELVRQIAQCNPKKLILFDNSEFLLYKIDTELSFSMDSKIERLAIIGDIREKKFVHSLIQMHAPDLVFHAAALKHVPLVEKNPAEAVLTNVLGTRHVADACHDCNVPLMVQVSTDKVVSPRSVMGATKKLAEMYCQSMDFLSKTRFVTVRFGNVLGSNGSVVPLFEEQIARGGPITVTHPEMTRYFMTIPEAVKLILVAAAIGRVTQASVGQIFVLDMGMPVRILDLAHQMIRMKGLVPEKDIKIVFTGVRNGEKLHEELLDAQETLLSSGYQGVRLASSRVADAEIVRRLCDELGTLAVAHAEAPLIERLFKSISMNAL